jgi:uncharacterized membrane protein YgdD (TMEM256/DUF423 family)
MFTSGQLSIMVAIRKNPTASAKRSGPPLKSAGGLHLKPKATSVPAVGRMAYPLRQKTIMLNNNISQKIIRVALATALILLIPLVAMQFTDEVNWSLSDFIIMGILLFGSGLVYVLTTRNMNDAKHRIAVGAIVLIALLLIWVHLAVGIVDSWPFAGS